MRRGLTLVELVITISLTAILAIPVGILLSEYFTGAVHARDATIAMDLARYELERLDGLNDFFVDHSPANSDLKVNCPSGSAVTQAFPNYQTYPSVSWPYTLTRVVDCFLGNCCTTGTANPGIKRVRVTVTKSGSIDPLATLTTYRTKNVLFGN